MTDEGPSLPPLEEVAPPAPVVPGSVGILGGTFDPIHHGHLGIAEEAREALGLERVLLVPAASPPHKPGRPVTDAAHRLAMVELAIAGNPAFAVQPDRGRAGRGLVLGGHAGGAALPRASTSPGSSSRPRRSPGSRPGASRTGSSPCAASRSCRAGGYEPLDRAWVAEQFPGREDRVAFLPGPLLPISGSVVRRRAAAGRSVRYLVPDAVARYIADHQLYTDPARRTQTT